MWDIRSESSAGNTRGLIEASRGLPKSWTAKRCPPRGIPAASLKLVDVVEDAVSDRRVFRGEYPRPH